MLKKILPLLYWPDPLGILERSHLPTELRSLLNLGIARLQKAPQGEVTAFAELIFTMLGAEAKRMAFDELTLRSSSSAVVGEHEVARRAEQIWAEIGDIELWRNCVTNLDFFPNSGDISQPVAVDERQIKGDGFAAIALVNAHRLERAIDRKASVTIPSVITARLGRVARLTTVTTFAAVEACHYSTSDQQISDPNVELTKTRARIFEQVQQVLEERKAKKRAMFAEAGKRGSEARLQKFAQIKSMVRELLPRMRRKSLARTALDICDELMRNSPSMILAPRTVEKYIKAIESEPYKR